MFAWVPHNMKIQYENTATSYGGLTLASFIAFPH